MAKWLIFDRYKLKYVDQGGLEYVSGVSCPEGVHGVLISDDVPLASGIDLDPQEYPLSFKSDGILYELTENNNNLMLTSSGNTIVDGFLPTVGGELSGFIVLHADPVLSGHAATKSYVDDQEAGDIEITVTGTNFVDAGISGTNIQDAVSDLVDAITQTDSRRAVNYVFTTGQSGDVKPYAETDSDSYAVVAQIIFPGTAFLGEPSLAQVLVSTQNIGITGTVRLYDSTNAVEIASVVTSSVTMEVINMTVASGSPWPTDEAVLEIQSVTSQNNRWTRVATLSLRWN